jgi:spore maturation protein CgeB
MQKIDYWLENQEKRNEIANEGQKHCYENFTYTQMVNEILKLR